MVNHKKFGIIYNVNPVFVQGFEADSHIRFQFIGMVLNGYPDFTLNHQTHFSGVFMASRVRNLDDTSACF